MNKIIALTNGRIITPFRVIHRGTVLTDGQSIKKVGPSNHITIPEGVKVIDVKNAFISPGFIDLHIHGAWGGDVMAGAIDDLKKMASGLVRSGTTAFLPTTLSGSMKQIIKAVKCIDESIKKEVKGARILGVHLEGPYFSMQQIGAQNPEYIIQPKPEDYLPLLNKYSCILRVSAAPEVPGALELDQELKNRGIIASIAHSNASYQEVLKAIEYGYSHVTHIYSGMSGLKRINAYRVSGVIESALLLDELTTEIIADGHHLPPSLMKLVLKTKGLEHVCLVTDSMQAAGLGAGRFNLGGLDVIVEDNIPEVFEVPASNGNYVAKLTDNSAFAGSVATMDKLVRNMVELVGLNIVDAVKLATYNPARMQNLDDRIGILAEGKKADITVFDDNIDIKLTMVGGEILYQHQNIIE